MTDKQAKIREALTKLDPANNDHWTADGSPRMDAVESLVGDGSINRKDVTDAAPTFNREHPTLEPVEAPDQTQDPGQGTTTAPVQEQQPNEQAPDPEQEPEPEPEPEPEDELELELRKAQEEFAEVEAAFEQARKRRDAIQAKIDRIVEARERNQPRNANMIGIRKFLDTQQRLRVERAERARQAQEASGLQVSKLDQVMRRKTGHGNQRPGPRSPIPGKE